MIKRFLMVAILFGMATIISAQNIVRVSNVTTSPGRAVNVTIDIDNPNDMITALQFNITLPRELEFVEGSCYLSRHTDHILSTNVYEDENIRELRIIVYSPSLSYITGTSGTVITFQLTGTELGRYPLECRTSILGGLDENNNAIELDHTFIPGSVTISNTPQINCGDAITMNPSWINANATEIFPIKNVGAADLTINGITFSDAGFSASDVPSTIPAGETAYIKVIYNGNAAGEYNGTMTISSNDPNGDKEVSIRGNIYENGVEIDVPSLNYGTEDVVWSINLNNVDPIEGIVMSSITFTYPSSYTISNDDIILGNRITSQYTQPTLSGNSCTIIFLGTISGNEGAVLNITMHPNGNSKSQSLELNINSATFGQITINQSTATATFTTHTCESHWTIPSGEYGEPGTFTECIDAINHIVRGGNVFLNDNIVISGNITIDSDVNIDYGNANELYSITINHGVSLINYNDMTASYILHIDNSHFTDAKGERWDADWHDISSPVANHPIEDFTTGNYDFYRYDEPSAVWQYHAGESGPFASMEPGRGYLVAFDTERDMTFNGMMQHGNVSIPITRENTGSLAGFNLLGNPYPSYLDWESVYHASTNVFPTIYVWDEDKSQYATYDANLQMGTFDKTQYLAPGQGFFVKCNNASGGNVVFDDNARCHKSSTEVPFRGENIIMKINVEGAVSGIDELIMKLNCPETAGALKMTSMSENAPYLSYEYENEDYVMICLGEELSKDSLPFKFKAGQNDDFIMTFDIQNFEGDFLELEDLLTGEKVDLLSQNHYNFAGAPNDVAQRFRINFKEALGVEGINERELFVYSNGDMVSIYGIQGRSQIRIYDVRGILLSEKTSGENNVELNISNYKSGLYIIQVSDETGVFTKKIIVGK